MKTFDSIKDYSNDLLMNNKSNQISSFDKTFSKDYKSYQNYY